MTRPRFWLGSLPAPIGYVRKQELLEYAPVAILYQKPPAPEIDTYPVRVYSEDQVRNVIADLLALPASGEALTDEDIVDIRDSLLPSQGDSFDCVMFARTILAARCLRATGETK